MTKENENTLNSAIESSDTLYEGKHKAYLDIDRMINEGLSGGNVSMIGEKTNIEEARDLHSDDEPHTIG